jgi:hypothetical protein
MIKIPLHSITDKITNSSITIFTYSEGSIDACKELINEIFKTFGVDKKCDDVFILTLLAEDFEIYYEYFENDDDDDDEGEEDGGEEDEKGLISEDELQQLNVDKREKYIESLIEDIYNGKVEKPKWMLKAEQKTNYYDLSPSTSLYIVSKEPQFEKLAKLIKEFLYSTEHEAVRDS